MTEIKTVMSNINSLSVAAYISNYRVEFLLSITNQKLVFSVNGLTGYVY